MEENPGVLLEAVIFDYGEVISERAGPAHMTNTARIAGLDEHIVKELYWKFRDEYDRGTYGGEGYWRAVGEAAGRRFSEDQIRELIHEDVVSWSRVREPVLAWQRKLRAAGIKTAVLSNMMPDLLAHMRGNFAWLRDFTFQTYSCEIGAVKPEKKIYEHALAGLAVAADRALFLDDREVNIVGARAAGLHGIVFQSLEDLREKLAHVYNVPLP
jgi:putative hydrolase of the HAD superfamily